MQHPSKIFLYRSVYFSEKYRLRRISAIFREKADHQKSSLGVWWDVNAGSLIPGSRTKEVRYFMIGIYFFKWVAWLDFKYIIKRKIK